MQIASLVNGMPSRRPGLFEERETDWRRHSSRRARFCKPFQSVDNQMGNEWEAHTHKQRRKHKHRPDVIKMRLPP